MTISKNHSNRKSHNWLMYDINDRFLTKHASLYRGALYDLGAGESPYKNFFLEHADFYVAVDWAGSLHQTRADIIADLNAALPITDSVADTVVSLSVLEHLREPQTMLDEAFRILKPGGHLILQVPWQWWIHEAPHDYFRYTPYGLQYLLGKSGFIDIKVEAQAGFFTMLIMKLNYFSLRFVRGPKFLRLIIKTALAPCWYLAQLAAPRLDLLDRHWTAESTSYFVTAAKPSTS